MRYIYILSKEYDLKTGGYLVVLGLIGCTFLSRGRMWKEKKEYHSFGVKSLLSFVTINDKGKKKEKKS